MQRHVVKPTSVIDWTTSVVGGRRGRLKRRTRRPHALPRSGERAPHPRVSPPEGSSPRRRMPMRGSSSPTRQRPWIRRTPRSPSRSRSASSSGWPSSAARGARTPLRPRRARSATASATRSPSGSAAAARPRPAAPVAASSVSEPQIWRVAALEANPPATNVVVGLRDIASRLREICADPDRRVTAPLSSPLVVCGTGEVPREAAPVPPHRT